MNYKNITYSAADIAAKRAAYLQEIAELAPSKVNAFKKAYKGASLRAAVNAMCLDCLQHDVAGIRHCTSPCCPLFEVRPYQRDNTDLDETLMQEGDANDQ